MMQPAEKFTETQMVKLTDYGLALANKLLIGHGESWRFAAHDILIIQRVSFDDDSGLVLVGVAGAPDVRIAWVKSTTLVPATSDEIMIHSIMGR